MGRIEEHGRSPGATHRRSLSSPLGGHRLPTLRLALDVSPSSLSLIVPLNDGGASRSKSPWRCLSAPKKRTLFLLCIPVSLYLILSAFVQVNLMTRHIMNTTSSCESEIGCIISLPSLSSPNHALSRVNRGHILRPQSTLSKRRFIPNYGGLKLPNVT